MLFRKDDHKEKDMDKDKQIEEIRSAMKENDNDVGMPAPVHVRQPVEKDSAPLFVKVEKYREVLSHVQEMKIFVSGVKQVFNVMQELETIRSDSLKILRATIQRLEKSMVEIDSELLRPKGIDIREMAHGEIEVQHIEDSLGDLHKQLLGLRNELQELK